MDKPTSRAISTDAGEAVGGLLRQDSFRLNRKKFFEFRGWKATTRLQKELSRFVISKSLSPLTSRLLCGIDVAYRGECGFASSIVWDAETRSLVDKASFGGIVKVDYLPGFLGFREGPLLVSAAERLRTQPDVFLVDGHGRAHPRRFGLACHVGLYLDKPTIGVAKSRFYGRTVGEDVTGLDGEVLGSIVETGSGKKFYVSVGHRIGLDDATRIVRACLMGDQIAPLRAAHLEAASLRRQGC